MSKKSGPRDSSHRDSSENKSQRNESRAEKGSSNTKYLMNSKAESKADFSEPSTSPSKKKQEKQIGRGPSKSIDLGATGVDSAIKAAERTRPAKRYKDSGSDAHPAGNYCSANKHEPCGDAPRFSPEQIRQFISNAEAHANGTATKSAGKKTEVPQVAQTVHIAQSSDLQNLGQDLQNAGRDKQKSAVQYQVTAHESFSPKHQSADHAASAKTEHAVVAKTEHPIPAKSEHTISAKSQQNETNRVTADKQTGTENQKINRSGRSFSSPEYDIHQDSLDFYQAHKKAFQTADQRFQNLPPSAQLAPGEHRQEGQRAEPISVGNQNNRPEVIERRPTERTHPYFAINGQLAKENSIFNPPAGEYRLTSIDKLDFDRHPEALRLDIPESRILTHVPAISADQMLHQAERIAGGLPAVPRPGEILDAVEAMMEHDPATKELEQTQEEHDSRHLVMLLDGKRRGILFPIKRGEQQSGDGIITGISKIFLPSGNFKFIREGKFSAKFEFPDIKGIIAKFKSNLQNKSGAKNEQQIIEPQKNMPETKAEDWQPVPTRTVVNPEQAGSLVVKNLKPGAAEPEPLAAQLIKQQKTKQQEIKKQEGKEPRPESKTGNKDPYQGKLPEIKMTYAKGQPATKDFTNLKPPEKTGAAQPAETSKETSDEQPTRIRDIYAKFDIQLPRKKLKPEITESGTYKIIPNQSSQKMQAVSDDAINAPFETASSIFTEEGDPRNPENKPFPKSAATSEEPRQSYVVKQGETVEYISVAELQDASLAPLIREINHILLDQFYDHANQQPVSVLPTGLLILLPNKKDIIAFRLKVARNRNS